MTAKAFNSVEELSTKIDSYFKHCDSKEEPYTMLGLAIYLDINKDTLWDYSKKEGYCEPIKKAKLKCESYAEKKLYKGGNPAGVIFSLKNNYGWTDKQEITNTNINLDPASLSPEDRAKRLEELKAKISQE